MKNRSRGQRDYGGQEMQRERDGHQRAIPDPVREEAEKDNRNAEACETATGDLPQFALREAELRTPVAQNAAADGKSDARSENGHESGPQEPMRIRGRIVALFIAHRLCRSMVLSR